MAAAGDAEDVTPEQAAETVLVSPAATARFALCHLSLCTC